MMKAYPMHGVCPINRMNGLNAIEMRDLFARMATHKGKALRELRREVKLWIKRNDPQTVSKPGAIRKMAREFSCQGTIEQIVLK